MMPITEEVHAFLTANAAAQIQRDDEYLDPADGLLHCKTCHGLRQTVIPAPGGTGFLRPRCLCPCQSAAEKQRKAAEEKRERLERIQRRKAHGLQDRRLYDCTFANDIFAFSVAEEIFVLKAHFSFFKLLAIRPCDMLADALGFRLRETRINDKVQFTLVFQRVDILLFKEDTNALCF